jgi:hypothetical protein
LSFVIRVLVNANIRAVVPGAGNKSEPRDADFKSIIRTASLMLAGVPGMWKRILAGEYGMA